MKFLKPKYVALAMFGVLLMMLAPLSAAAITNSEVIAIFAESISGLLELTGMAYCASDVIALC